MMKTIYRLLMLMLLPLLAACSDDYLDGYGPDGYPEGETLIDCEMDFEPYALQSVDTRATVAPPGNGLNEINDLVLVAYDKEGRLMEGFPIEITKAEHNLDVRDTPRTGADASNGATSETETKRAKFRLKLPYGRYYLYGVANLGQITTSGNANTMTQTTLQYLTSPDIDISTRDNFLSLQRSWDPTNYRNNAEMLGYFTDGAEEHSPSTGLDTNNKTISIDRPGMTIHSWLRRLASKVTIDFDGSALSDNIKIYVHKATIHDIPAHCYIGKPNAIASTDPTEMITNKGSDYRPDGCHHIDYGEGDFSMYTTWPFVSKDHPHITDDAGNVLDFHGNDMQALFLYENMQGTGPEGKDTHKPQTPMPDGSVVGADENKDNVEMGSYIEVECYYELISSTQIKKGTLYYRFMLGKDAEQDFNVERNHHYKITMCPRGYGNDVDWHIEYNEDEGFEVKNPYYVSYLYNHDSTIRFRYTPKTGEKVVGVKAEIVGNNWWGDNMTYETASWGSTSGSPQDVINAQKPTTASDELLFTSPNKATFGRVTHTSGILAGRSKYLGNGFLSLWPTDNGRDILPSQTNYENLSMQSKDWYPSEGARYMNDFLFYGATEASKYIDRSRREYDFKTPSGDMEATITNEANGSVRIDIPMWTRAKNLVKASGHTSNNPFSGHTRSAYVKLTVLLEKNGQPVAELPSHSEIVRVQQVKRIVNPKAIYRSNSCSDSFNVTLMELPNEHSVNFVPVESDGPWLAEVLGEDNNFINLNGRQAVKGNGQVSFTIHFNRMYSKERPRNAIIRVRYNDYACVHLIFVHQGYSPQAIEDSGTLWHSRNMITAKTEAEDPRDEGSLFKFGNEELAIDAANNTPFPYGSIIKPTDFSAPAKYYPAMDDRSLGEQDKTWSGFTSSPAGFKTMNAPTMQQFQALFYNSSNLIDTGFGVLYADGATETASAVADAYGWYRHEADKTARDKKGMRGVIVYNNTTGRNFFMPIGRSGYGHRKNSDLYGTGTLRYSCLQIGYFHYNIWTQGGLTWLHAAPLFFENFCNPGAIYWAKNINSSDMVGADGQKGNTDGIGLDINYYTLDFNLITKSNLADGADACFVRCVGN